jgi:hypothetical protein
MIMFDLDGTLGLFGGGFQLLREALGDLWGATPTAADLARCSGSTDWEIVDQLHAIQFGGSIPDTAYAAYDRACLARFAATFHPQGRQHEATGSGWCRATPRRCWISRRTSSGWIRASHAWAACPAWTAPA